MNDLTILNRKAGATAEALELAEEVLDINHRSGLGNTWGNVVVQVNHAALLSDVGEVTAATDVLRDLLERLQRSGIQENRYTHRF